MMYFRTDYIENSLDHHGQEHTTMNKLQLIQALKESQDLSKTEAAKCVELFFNAMADALSIGDHVEIRDLCSFHVREYDMNLTPGAIQKLVRMQR